VYDFNKAAISCYKNAGLVIEGTNRDCLLFKNQWWSLAEMSILEEEWKDEKKNGRMKRNNFLGQALYFYGIILMSLPDFYRDTAYHWGTVIVFCRRQVVEKLNFKRFFCKMRFRIFMSWLQAFLNTLIIKPNSE
jgi:hypothetical protein